jgi:hypothetical protein
MRAQIIPASALVVSIIGFGLFLNTPAPAQVRINLPNSMAAIPHDTQTMEERMSHLEAVVGLLQAQLAADEKKLQEASAAAAQANTGVNFINMGFGKQIENLQANQNSVAQYMNNTNGVIAGLDQKLNVLSDHFEHHTHSYLQFSLTLDSDNNTVTGTKYTHGPTDGPKY